MEITFTNSGPQTFKKYKSLYIKLAKDVFAYLKINANYVLEVNITDDAKIQEINRAYRGLDRPTDVISFAFLDNIVNEPPIIGEVPRLLGEIIISYETAIRQAEAYGHSLEREMKFLFTHGMLHLLGYDHQDADQEKIMF
ncbi:MAG: rRNA maturation RNase YbeY, partial [Erysipelotrichia bacterium]|nr:rRNA maturation RNase YbeY [Erysipelotrichia bacterium]